MNKNDEYKQKIVQSIQYIEDDKFLEYLYTLLCKMIAKQVNSETKE